MYYFDPLDRFLRTNPDLIRTLLDIQPKHNKLSEEIAYILEKEISAAKIKIAYVRHRTKSIESFCNKADRKRYFSPLEKIKDISGVRLVYLYIGDKPKIANIVENTFHVLEKDDKENSNSPTHYGYEDLSYIVKLKENNYNMRLSELQNLECEIQIRTTLQDAWALVSHHLCYKQESYIPNEFQEDLKELIGIFKSADDKFSNLKVIRENYEKEVEQNMKLNFNDFLEMEFNLDNLITFLKWK
jgi:ppGpp synthetase/RelA/SpoT-type nucleotidyltranferase